MKNNSQIVLATYLIGFLIFSLSSFASIPPAYYNSASGKSGAELKTALHEIICNDTINYLSYGAGVGHTWEGFYYTDRNTTDNSVVDMYSSILRYFPNPNPTFASMGNDVHIEHSFPKSWWRSLETAPYKDLHHLYPADGSTNISKSNYPLGEVTGAVTLDNGVSKMGYSNYEDYTGKVFEPADEYKGDFARSYFYMVTAYQNYYNLWDSPMLSNNTYPTFNNWSIELLLTWHHADPVSEKELARTEVVYQYQNNRNPFIDHPEIADYIWGDSINQQWLQSYIKPVQNSNIYEIIQDSTYITVNSNSPSIIYIIFYDMLGIPLISKRGFNSVFIPVFNLPEGIYLLSIKVNNQFFSEKIFVNLG